MKNKIYLGLITLGFSAIAQQNPTNNSPSAPGQNGTNAKDFWSRAGALKIQ